MVKKRQAGCTDGSLKKSSNFVKTCAAETNTAHLQLQFVVHIGVPLKSLVRNEQFQDNCSITFNLFQILLPNQMEMVRI